MPEDSPDETFEDVFDNIEFPAELFDFLSDIVNDEPAMKVPVAGHPSSQKHGKTILSCTALSFLK